MCEDQIKFEQIKNKIIKDFEPILIAYGEFLTININDNDTDKLRNLEKAISSFHISFDDNAEISFAQAYHQFSKDEKCQS